MSIRLVDLVLRTDLRSTEKLVLLVVADAASDEGVAWPRQSVIAKKASVSERTVGRVLSDLEAGGIVEITQRGRNRSNLYRIRVKRLRGLAAEPPEPVVDGPIPDEEVPDRASVPASPDPTDVPVRTRQGVRSGPDGESDPMRTVREPSPEPSIVERERSKKRDLVFEALCEACGIDYSSTMTKSQRGAINKAAKELREIEATPEEIFRVAAAYRIRWPSIDVTPNAITKHWNLVRAPLPSDEASARVRRSMMRPPDEIPKLGAGS